MRVLQVINSLSVGGAENLLCESLPFYVDCNIDIATLTSRNNVLYNKAQNSTKGKIFELGNGSVYNPFVIVKLLKLIRNYDIIHIHLFPSLYFVVVANLLLFRRRKLIYTEHSTNNRRRSGFLLRIVDKFIYRHIDAIISIAQDVDKELKAHLGANSLSKVILIENGINLDKFIKAEAYPKSQFFNDPNSKILIQVSSFRFPKDQKTLIQALTHLPDIYKLILVGTGPLLEDNIAFVKTLALENRVLFLGLRDDIPRLLKTSDVIVLSSKYEGLSLSSIEGMVVGKPFIASDVKGLREIVKGNGLIFPFGDAKELAYQIGISVNDLEKREQIISTCYQKAIQYDIKNMVKRYIDIYSLLSHSRSF
ncbi:glycosyltransferase [Sphingobacterium sp.]|uniref:glycosyltransferase n=1 Tax=Sphingobacterium sp. TaxID=341027 RepID=UPI0031E28A2C